MGLRHPVAAQFGCVAVGGKPLPQRLPSPSDGACRPWHQVKPGDALRRRSSFTASCRSEGGSRQRLHDGRGRGGSWRVLGEACWTRPASAECVRRTQGGVRLALVPDAGRARRARIAAHASAGARPGTRKWRVWGERSQSGYRLRRRRPRREAGTARRLPWSPQRLPPRAAPRPDATDDRIIRVAGACVVTAGRFHLDRVPALATRGTP